jgi:NADH-quinone oxidoreductase subunit C
MDSTALKQEILARFPQGVEEAGDVFGVPTLYASADVLLELCRSVKDTPEMAFDYLMSETAVDWRDRFDVVYHLYSIRNKNYVTIKVKVDRKNPSIPSVYSIWKAADWQEREIYDMFGIDFQGHPDLRRILLEEDWEGFPLRKDYVMK